MFLQTHHKTITSSIYFDCNFRVHSQFLSKHFTLFRLPYNQDIQMMYRSRNSNPSQPNPKPLLLNKHAKIKYSENPNSVTEKMRSPFLQVDTHQKKQEWMGHRVTPSSPLPPSQLTETPLILLLSSPSKPSPSQFPTQVKQQRSCEPVLFTPSVGIMTPFSDNR